MVVPPHPVVGSTVKLKCEYDMEGAEVYSVKWYKGGAEFYRYLPKDRPPAQIYQVHGTKVDVSNSSISSHLYEVEYSDCCNVNPRMTSFITSIAF